MELRTKIRMIRKARGLSQEELGNSLTKISSGISRQSVSDWETGKSEPKLDNIRDLATVLYCSYDALLDENIDLTDPKVFTAVLNNTYKAEEPSNKRVLYEFRKRTVNVYKVISLLTILVAFGIAIMMLVQSATAIAAPAETVMGGINGIKSHIPGLVISILAAACLGPGIWVWLIDSMRKDLNAPYGELTSLNLAIRDSSVRGGFVLLPLEDIERAEISKKSTVNVFLLERQNPVSIKHVKDPSGIVEAINTAVSNNVSNKNASIK